VARNPDPDSVPLLKETVCSAAERGETDARARSPAMGTARSTRFM
jgi:hypothetical protein